MVSLIGTRIQSSPQFARSLTSSSANNLAEADLRCQIRQKRQPEFSCEIIHSDPPTASAPDFSRFQSSQSLPNGQSQKVLPKNRLNRSPTSPWWSNWKTSSISENRSRNFGAQHAQHKSLPIIIPKTHNSGKSRPLVRHGSGCSSIFGGIVQRSRFSTARPLSKGGT